MLDSEAANQHVSSFDLDLLEIGGLDDVRKRKVDDHLRGCDACRQEQQSLRKLRAEFTNSVLPRTIDVVRKRARSSGRPGFVAPKLWAPLLASATAFALWALVRQPGQQGHLTGQDLQTKGKAELQLVARHDGRVTTVDRFNRNLRPGDELRFVVTATDPEAPYLLVVSVDGAGRANVYHPYNGAASGRIEHPGRWEVPGSVVLDESSGPERIFALFSKEPLKASIVTEALAAIGKRGWEAIRTTERLDVAGVDQTSFVIEKAATPAAP
jgi:hypothetical protein